MSTSKHCLNFQGVNSTTNGILFLRIPSRAEISSLRLTHPCPDCGEVCDCDREYEWNEQSPAGGCAHDCDADTEEAP